MIQLQNLTKYYGKSKGISGVDLEVGDGEIFGFIGPNGSGKSTTIRILMSLIFPSSGRARIQGLDITRDARRIHRFTGYVPSDAQLYSRMSVGEFLRYCLGFYQMKETGDRIGELCTYFQLDPGRRMEDLSMGNKKKVSIIQSLVHRPRLLILDEPTTGLDPLVQAKFFELLEDENRKGMTIFFSSHILSEVQLLCHRVGIIKDGSMIQVGTLGNLRGKPLKKVSILFEGPVPDWVSRIPVEEELSRKPDSSVSFIYAGELGVLLRQISESRVLDLRMEEPSLEEIFRYYYQ